MKKRLSFISGLTALVFSLLTFTSSAVASDVAEGQDSPTNLPQNEEITIETPILQDDVEDENIDSTIEGAPSETIEESSVAENNGTEEETVEDDSNSQTTDLNQGISEDGYEITPVDEDEDETIPEDEEFLEMQDALKDVSEDNTNLISTDLSSEVPDESGNIVVDNTTSGYDNLLYAFSHEDFAAFLNEYPGLSFVTKMSQVELSVPAANLTTGNFFAFAIIKDSQSYLDALSNVYDFYILYPNLDSGLEYDLEFVKTFTKPVTLKFFIDPTKVGNWENVTIAYINKNGEMEDFIAPKSINRETGEVTVEVNHFSKYGVFEIASTNNNNDNNNAGTGGSNNNGTGTTTTTPANNTTPTNTNTVANAVTKTNTGSTGTTAAGNQLPNTATNSYNILLLGLSLLAIGGLFFVRKNRQAN
jgi:LPXTG-motif cell wall-anchored protein